MSNSISGTKSYTIKLKDSSKTSSARIDLNDCLLESENFQITKSDNNKYLLLPVKKSDNTTEKFVLKECGKDISDTSYLLLPSLYSQNIPQPSIYTPHTKHDLIISFLFILSMILSNKTFIYNENFSKNQSTKSFTQYHCFR